MGRNNAKEPEVVVRGMKEDDLAAAQPLLKQLGYDLELPEIRRRYAALTKSDGHTLMVAEVGGRMVSLLHVYARLALEKPLEAIVQALVVDSACRQSGIGKVMMAAAEGWAVERGFRSVALSSQVHREGAHAFYNALGYEVSATSYSLRKQLGV